uniref:RNA 3'-terminal-phosphate cyclase (ATP) n=1 Tax=Eucampia antarctica TaxID=49252 RepID=A0A7S2RL33_9STRA|mmetsp:Transcript_23717/g.22752  ORF Transcript_23717/g.22752 Transcript_23717/m.22752 type:complete len:384 (+) Transcript_23717:73-1224(+)
MSSKNATPSYTSTIKFDDGAVQFRLRLALSLLSHRTVLIRNIRSDDVEEPGLRDYEVSFLQLLDNMTNGSHIEINSTGTQVRFRPGILTGGYIQHECPQSRSVGWFLEGLLPLTPFGKEALTLDLTGMTNGTSHLDPSPDYIISSIIPLLRDTFEIVGEEAADIPHLKVLERGAAPLGVGRVELYCPRIKELTTPIDMTDVGMVKRVRGTVVSCRIPPSSAARAAHSAKGLLHRLIPDVWIHTDTNSNRKSNTSPGMSISMSAETNTGCFLTAETCLPIHKTKTVLPEDLGVRASALLLEEIRKGGSIDTHAQSLVLLLMCLGPEGDVTRIRTGALSEYTVSSLRLYKHVLGVEFKLRPDTETQTIVLSCLGSGYRNMARTST